MIWKMWCCAECRWEATEGCIKHEIEEVGVSTEGLLCPGCGTLLSSYVHVGPGHVGIFSQETRYSMSMGVHPSQVPAAMKKWPGSRFTPDGRLEYNGRTEKKVRMKQRGYIETE